MKNHLGEEDKMITWIFFEQGNETNYQGSFLKTNQIF